jgi:hypothetical protein
MRTILRTTLVVLAAGAALLPAQPASAYCNAALYVVTGTCTNECRIVHGVYRTADGVVGVLPDLPADCPA